MSACSLTSSLKTAFSLGHPPITGCGQFNPEWLTEQSHCPTSSLFLIRFPHFKRSTVYHFTNLISILSLKFPPLLTVTLAMPNKNMLPYVTCQKKCKAVFEILFVTVLAFQVLPFSPKNDTFTTTH